MLENEMNKNLFAILSVIVCLISILFLILQPTHADEMEDTSFLDNHIITSTNPEGIVINMFDYWNTDSLTPPASDATDPDQIKTATNKESLNPDLGINQNHLLLFRRSQGRSYGAWNSYIDLGIEKPSIVQRNLGSDGYPCLNLYNFMNEHASRTSVGQYPILGTTYAWETYEDFAGFSNESNSYSNHLQSLQKNKNGLATESLAYLFDPDIEHNGKVSYTNVTGLFQTDGNGYYYFNSIDNFISLENYIVTDATKRVNGAKLTMYDVPATMIDGKRSDGPLNVGYYNRGHFYPFNKASEFFIKEENGELVVDQKYNLDDATAATIGLNHYFGMTIEVPFVVPEDGVLKNINLDNGEEIIEDIIYDFKGDDDVWVFIDDVLVLDLSGLHPSSDGKINFSTGEITRKINNIRYDTIKNAFKRAGKENTVAWETTSEGNEILQSGTHHVMKMYYLERGHFASNLNFKFNLQTQTPIDLKKIDRDTNGIKGVEFELYQAKDYKPEGDAEDVTLKDVKEYIKPENLISTLTTDKDGNSSFMEKVGNIEQLINFSKYYDNGNGTQIYILKEKSAPSNYQPLANEIVLRYDPTFKMLLVNNKFETGAYANFAASIYGNNQISYTTLDVTTGLTPYNASDRVDANTQASGLVIGIPLIKKNTGWTPIFGSNLKGFDSLDDSYGDINDRILASILYQAIDSETPEWYFTYNDSNGRLEAKFNSMPGTIDRYFIRSMNTSPDYIEKDMQVVYGLITGESLNSLGIKVKDEDEKYQALKNYLLQQVNSGKSVEEVIKETVRKINEASNFSLVNTANFSFNFSSTIYVSNDARELVVNKIDEEENPINGVVFSLYESETDAENNTNPIATGTTGTVNGQDGVLIFTPNVPSSEGYAYMIWTGSAIGTQYYLKEVSAPAGYIINETIIPVLLGEHSVYADAGTDDDGVSVKAGVGRLVKTLHRYAIDRDVDITLRDIKLIAQTQDSHSFVADGWQDSANGETLELHTYQNSNLEYTLHKGEEGEPYIESEKGFLRTRVIQNYGIHSDPSDEEYVPILEREVNDDLTDIYRIVNIVVIKNKYQNKTISGIAFEDTNKDDLYDESDDILLPNIKVSLINPINNSVLKETTTNDDGYYNFTNLELNKYLVKFELQDGYIIVEKGTEDNSSKANPDGLTDEIVFVANYEKEIKIEHINLGLRMIKFEFTKIEKNNESIPIRNDGLFELYEYICDIDDEAYENKLVNEKESCFKKHGTTISTDSEGKILFTTLKPAIYRLVEKEAPKGFVRPSGEWNITFEGSNIKTIECVGGESRTCPAFKIGEDGNLYLPNMKMIEVPNSGGLGQILLTSFGVILMGMGFILALADRKVKK